MSAAYNASWPAAAEGLFQRPPSVSESCELTLLDVPQDAVGVRLVSSARTCEVYSLGLDGQRSYVCSLRGSPVPHGGSSPAGSSSGTVQAPAARDGQGVGQQDGERSSQATAAAAAALPLPLRVAATKAAAPPSPPAAAAAAAAAAGTDGTPPSTAPAQPATQSPQQRWAVEHRWQRPPPAGRPALLLLRLLSLAVRDKLHLDSMQLLTEGPGSSSSGSSGGQAAHGRSAAAASSSAGQDAAGAPATEAQSAAVAAAAAGAGAAAAQGLGGGAGGGSQLDDVRAMLSQLAAEDRSRGSSGSGAPLDPKRALMAAIARSVLQQQPAAAAPMATMRQQQPLQQQPLQQQPQPLQQQQQEGREQQQGSCVDVSAALQRLEGRVAALEALCTEMHGMLRQLVAGQAAPG